jgi:hypothetical protein
MTEFVDAAIVILLPMSVLVGALCFGCIVAYIVDVLSGYEELPRLHKKRPRKAATSRGMVGKKIRRPVKDSYIVAQKNGDVKVSWVYYRR